MCSVLRYMSECLPHLIAVSSNTESLMKDTDPILDTLGSEDHAFNESKNRELNDDNAIYNLWTFGNINLLVRWHADGYIGESEKVSTYINTIFLIAHSSHASYHRRQTLVLRLEWLF